MQPIRHGEVILKPIDTLPEGATLQEETYKTIVAHSETGHHHILEVKEKINTPKIKVYVQNGDTYLEVPTMTELWHQKTGEHVHTTHVIPPSLYKLQKKKEYDYAQNRLREVRD